MKSLKRSAAVAVVAVGAVALLLPGSVLAASHHRSKTEAGTLSAYAAGSSATVNGVRIRLTKHTKLVSEDAAAKTAGPVAGDSAVAFIRWHKHTALAKKLEYGTTAFVYLKRDFSGRYVSSMATSVTIRVHKKMDTFNTDSSTKYYQNGHSVLLPSYRPKERVTIRGEESTNGSWYAAVVRLHHGKHGKKAGH